MMRADDDPVEIDDDNNQQEIVMTEGGGIETPPPSPSKVSANRSANKTETISTVEPPSSASKKSKKAAALEAAKGTILEAAFVDPAYSWPPQDGEGKNAIELQASINLMDDSASDCTTSSVKDRMKLPTKPPRPDGVPRCGFFRSGPLACCRSDEAVVRQYANEMKKYEAQRMAALQARKEYAAAKRLRAKTKARQYRKDNKYNLVPEGILVYRLDTSTHVLSLVSTPHARTNVDLIPTEVTVLRANPSPDKTRRGIEVTATNGQVYTLVACEQRTATAWLEAMNLMKAKRLDPTQVTSAQDVSKSADEHSFAQHPNELHRSQSHFLPTPRFV
jgi:hypothetical protein